MKPASAKHSLPPSESISTMRNRDLRTVLLQRLAWVPRFGRIFLVNVLARTECVKWFTHG
jgi:hypothetical protein